MPDMTIVTFLKRKNQMIRTKPIVFMTAVFIMALPVLSFGGTVDLSRTGQTTCYDSSGNVIDCNGTGQDGEIQAGVQWPEPRFVDNGDGTVTDNLTGLMWLKDASCLGARTWQSALDVVADFNANPGNYDCTDYTANYTDWVLPNMVELETLVNAEESSPAAWLNSQGFTYVQSSYYWSATTCAYNTNCAWFVYMSFGSVYYSGKSYDYFYVWPVRAGQ